MSPELREVLIDALGIGWKGHGRTPWRNRTACNTRNVENYAPHTSGVILGLLVADTAEDYGRMRVYRVTEGGCLFLTGKKLPKKLSGLIPAEPKPLSEPDLAEALAA